MSGWMLALLTAASVLAIAGCPRVHDATDGGRALDAPALARDAPAGRDVPVADVPRIDAPEPPPPRTATFLLTGLDLPTAAGDRIAGLDLDDTTSTGGGRCDEAEDFTSPVTGRRGVDNQFAARLGTTLSTVVPEGFLAMHRRRMVTGDDLLLLELDDIDSLEADDFVSVHMFLGRYEREGRGPEVDGAGVVLAGQRFEELIDLGTSPGRIVGHRLITSATAFAVPLQSGGGESHIPVRSVRIEAHVTATALSDGEIGGTMTSADIAAASEEIGIAASPTIIEGLVAPDLTPSSDGTRCAGISVGFTFDAVAAISLGPADF